MPRVSQARRTLTRLLEAETDPQKSAALATRLAAVIHQENLERGRRRRAKRNKPEPVVAPKDDSNEPFELYDENDASPYPPPTITPQPSIAVVQHQEVFAPAPEPAVIVAEEPPPAQTGFTRVISAMNAPGAMYWDGYRREWREDFEPRSSVGPANWMPAETVGVESFTYSGGEWDFETKQREEREKEARWQEQRIWGR